MDKGSKKYWKEEFRKQREKELSHEDKFNGSIAIPVLASLIAAVVMNYFMK